MKKILILICAILIQCSISSVRDGEEKIIKTFQKTFSNSKYSKSATLLVHSDSMNIHIESSAGFMDDKKKITVENEQPFHIASIGKLFTVVLIFQLIETGKIKLDTKISKVLNPETLKNLFVIDGVDYSHEVSIEELLSHTSGIADYFESIDNNEKSLLNEIQKQPDKFWTPKEILEFTKNNQKPIARPKEKFHYSDTGYIILGLIIEKITNKSFEKNMEEKIFSPLGMKNSYVYLRSEPINKTKIAPVSTMMLGSKNVTNYKSISADWAGGGIVSTTQELLIFYKALLNGKLISKENYHSLRGKNKFLDGIYYGKGLMTVRFQDMSFLMPKTPDLYGHSGLLGTLLFYSPEYDSYIIANLGSTEDVGDSFEMMFWIMQELKEIKNLKGQKN
jgi:D-alanyl-D-alanine carboxypeptidase